jgi:sugar transferase (PEP-CTERM/EpsH1 system associated)
MKAVASTENSAAISPAARETRTSAGAAPLRVLHVIDRLDMGGTEYVILKVMAGLGGGEFEHRVCAARGYNESLPHLQKMQDQIVVAGRNESKFQLLLFHLAGIMREFRPHIVHSRNWGAIEAIPAARLAGVPIAIHSEHGYIPDMLAGLPARQRVIRRGAYAMADAVFCVTDELRNFHARQAWLAPERIQVLHNGVDTERYSPLPEVRRTMRERLRISSASLVLGIVSRLVPIKDHATLFRAAERLAAHKIDVRVIVAGTGPERERLDAIVKASSALAGRVSFVGASENVPEILNALDIFVLPSLMEGMSNTILEAMSCGLPVAATRVGGNRELVQEGRTGVLFTPGDDAHLAGQIELLAANEALRSDYGAAGRRRVLEDFSLDKMLAGYRHLYRDLAVRKGALKEVRA